MIEKYQTGVLATTCDSPILVPEFRTAFRSTQFWNMTIRRRRNFAWLCSDVLREGWGRSLSVYYKFTVKDAVNRSAFGEARDNRVVASFFPGRFYFVHCLKKRPTFDLL